MTVNHPRSGAPCKISPRGASMIMRKSHPLSLCNTSEDERQESDFISIVKLESPERKVPQCLPLLDKEANPEDGCCTIINSGSVDLASADHNLPRQPPHSFPGSHRSSFPGSHRSSFPGSHRSSFPGSHRSSFPGSHRSSFPGSHRSSFPSHRSFPGSSSFPGSHRSSFPGSHRSSFPKA
ncbi:hypothetical protein J4Q44_G00129520 [Coregonus suidteri]|uniref:ZNRF-3 ectodomain domain-containing protein n=1 Tax=Coregonus suidteri TaxID=861788 RepID=A0AAN8LY63_9TELE